MTERLLQFIWQCRYFNPHELCIETGEALQIICPGELNTHQGPDFLQAAIRIGNTLWSGNIELHLLTSGWKKHAHEGDRHYNNVILHVVWEDDRERADRRPVAGPARDIPLLVLHHRVPKLLLGKYEEWMKSRAFVACERQLPQAGEALWSDWKQKLVIGRLERKTLIIREELRQNRQHWEQTAWWLMARNFGIPVNAGVFGTIAKSLPLAVLSRCRQRPELLEALLLGQAGLLAGDHNDEWLGSLQAEFLHLRGKYRLPAIHEPLLSMRMRPGNFPAVRLAQLAAFLHRSFSWFGHVRDAACVEDLMALLDVAAGSYWDHHYQPGKRSAAKVKKLGSPMKASIVINTFLPLLYAYGALRKEKGYREKALKWMQELGPEKNSRMADWARLGVGSRHAADSQALLELKTAYCDPRRCLECDIGKALLGQGTNREGFRQACPPSS
jgi:hypothetical protein